MQFTPAQMAALKANILASSDLNSQPNNSDGAYEIARLYNLQASPNFTLWKKSVPISQVGMAMRNTDVANLTTANTNRLQTLAAYSGGAFNPSLTDTRAGFDDIFSTAGAAPTRANLLVLWKRFATRIEKLFATGTGSDASPATSAFDDDFVIAWQDVEAARNS